MKFLHRLFQPFLDAFAQDRRRIDDAMMTLQQRVKAEESLVAETRRQVEALALGIDKIVQMYHRMSQEQGTLEFLADTKNQIVAAKDQEIAFLREQLARTMAFVRAQKNIQAEGVAAILNNDAPEEPGTPPSAFRTVGEYEEEPKA